MKALVILSLLFSPLLASANDGGIAGIKVSDIKMREYQIKDGVEKEVRRIAEPNFKILFTGQQADRLQQILPSVYSVITGMQPELAEEFNRTFKTLGIYNDAVKNGSGKVIVSSKFMTISCSDGELVPDGDDKMKIVKAGKSSCEITINSLGEDGADMGDISEFEPGTCK